MAFVVEIARRLHQYGTAAARLEDAIDSVSARLQLNCHALSTPTSIVFSFTDRATGGALAELTRMHESGGIMLDRGAVAYLTTVPATAPSALGSHS